MKKILGIYAIQNIKNGKMYIGSSVNIKYRWCIHKANLNSNRHVNVYLQRSWNKYGSNNFRFFVLEECLKEKLEELELAWVIKLNTHDKRLGYNLTTQTTRQTIMNKEIRIKKSCSAKNNGKTQQQEIK